jgi:hypothetical protein
MAENPFELLQYLSAEDVASIAYYSILLIEHRTEIDAEWDDEYLVAEAEGISSEPTLDIKEGALDIIRSIESQEGVSLNELGQPAASRYIEELTDLLLDRAGSDFDSDRDRGRKLLDELRPKPDHQAAVKGTANY